MLAADGTGALGATADRLWLELPPESCDARAFASLAGSDRPAEQCRAAALYAGDLLQDIALTPPLDDWRAGHAAELRRRALALCERLGLQAGAEPALADAAVGLARRLLARDPTAEEAHRTLIRVHLARGQANLARRQLEECIAVLRRELDADPEPATTGLLDAPGPPAAAPERATIQADQPPSLVVMPFDNLGPADDSYFADGVVEEITSALSRIRDFFVVARQSAFAYRGRFVDVREVGAELAVRYVIEGTVRRGGERVRISVQLVDAQSRAQLWSDRYEGTTADIFELQDRIAAQVAGAIQPSIRASEIENARRKPPDNLGAYDLVLRAYPHFWAHDRVENRKALALLGEALARDPDYAVAMALKAWCHAQEACYLWSPDPARERALAVRLADEAANRVEDHATALVAIGAAYGLTTTDQDRAALHIRRALAIDANHAWGWTRLGWSNYLANRPDEAIEYFDRALSLSPLDPLAFNVHFGKAAAFSLRRDYATAIGLVERALHAHPRAVWAYRMLASYHANNGDLPKARKALATFLEHHPGATVASVAAGIPPSLPLVDKGYLTGMAKAGLPLE
ncbi:MAG: tetratricopeptide repeat protein [Geminicoccaceae bacterium]